MSNPADSPAAREAPEAMSRAQAARQVASALRDVAFIIRAGSPEYSVSATEMCSEARSMVPDPFESRALVRLSELFGYGQERWSCWREDACSCCEFLVGYFDVIAMGGEPPSQWLSNASALVDRLLACEVEAGGLR